MWKSILDALIESFAASDPNVYLYWRCAHLEAEEKAARSEQPMRSTARLQGLKIVPVRKEASA